MAYKEFYEQLLEEQTAMEIQDNNDDIRDAFLDDPENEIALADDAKVKELIDKIPADDDIPTHVKKECGEGCCKESAVDEASHKTNEEDEWDKMYNYDVYDDPTEPIKEDVDEEFVDEDVELDESFDIELDEMLEEDFMIDDLMFEEESAEEENDTVDEANHGFNEDEDEAFSKEEKEMMKKNKEAVKEDFDDLLFEDFEEDDDFMFEADLDLDDFDDEPALEGDLADAYHDDKEYLAKYSTGSEDSKSFDKAVQGELNKDHLEDVYPNKDEYLVKEEFEDLDDFVDFDFDEF